MGDDPFTVRVLTPRDVVSLRRVLASAFLTELDDGRPERVEHVIEFDRTVGVFQDDDLVGVSAVLSREITLPGGAVAPTAALTTAGVRPGYQRKGVLNRLVSTLVDGIDEAFAILWASEGAIYSRFGCGSLASDLLHLELPHGAPFHAGVDIGEALVREVSRAEALPVLEELYDRVRTSRVGWLGRTGRSWEFHLADDDRYRDGLSAFRFALHPRGYVVYRVRTAWDARGPKDELHVHELVAETDVAHAALYRHLLDLGLGGEVKHYTSADDPVVHMLADPRSAIRHRNDALWVRLVHVDRALELRHYLSDVDAVVEVLDPLVPRNAGRWHLTVEKGRATVRRTDAAPDATADVAALGSAFLGGTRLTVLARAGRVREHTPGTVAALSTAFLGDHAPHCPELF
ncbi:GNAT family N-acetyltransferase [Umezawaea tangerina]|uniref:Putative acetyltransferase n=1 Tax=Umezawaea tangerina TaxID=84725 RepID=A0A2T0TFS7_9PSEU|nr:GNAT family N-acetyltransferase [Umezawaea tangerina]PRY44527.1 putative acetyltransferase [Umezawaea tangerina]